MLPSSLFVKLSYILYVALNFEVMLYLSSWTSCLQAVRITAASVINRIFFIVLSFVAAKIMFFWHELREFYEFYTANL